MLSTVLMSMCLGFFQKSESVVGQSVFSLLSLIISAWITMVLVYASADAFSGRSVQLKELLKRPQRKFPNYLMVSVIFSFGILISVIMVNYFIGFIVPFIYIFIVYNFVTTIVVLEDVDVKTAFVRSAFLVKGHFFEIFLFLSFISLQLLLVLSLVHIGFKGTSPIMSATNNKVLMTFLIPFVVVTQVGLYLAISNLEKDDG